MCRTPTGTGPISNTMAILRQPLETITDTLGSTPPSSTIPVRSRLLQTTDPFDRVTSFHYAVTTQTITHSVETGGVPFVASIDLTATSLDEITNADNRRRC